jgi:hypothetical protein
MPDGDIIHAKLPRRYQKAYRQICEGQFCDEELAHGVLHALKKDIQRYGDEPQRLLKQAVTQLRQIPSEPLLKQTMDWSEESHKIDKLAQQSKGSRRAKELAIKACKEQLLELRCGEHSPDLLVEITTKYMRNVYVANFEELAPLAEHYNGLDQATFDARLESIRPYVDQEISGFAATAVRHDSVVPLRMRPRPGHKQSIRLDDDLSLLGR